MNNTALLLVDFQNDYFSSFKEAKFALNKTEEASLNALTLLKYFRAEKMKVVHIKHEASSSDAAFFIKGTTGAQIHESLKVQDNEDVVLKHHINAFKGTNLKKVLDDSNISNVIIVGAMSHMCVDALTRAASDFDYNCFVANDACATKDLEFNEVKVEASLVHAAFMSALEFAYAKVQSTKEILNILKMLKE